MTQFLLLQICAFLHQGQILKQQQYTLEILKYSLCFCYSIAASLQLSKSKKEERKYSFWETNYNTNEHMPSAFKMNTTMNINVKT